ncbi:hypothetical protein FN846DRAFT_911417 [Sphaerosporella brunnea]|uniref:NADH dehydrogenase [ubiquinone] iron-sulfur protein 5 n=1 Tax=Sphaerosporella brunnea TaxID=1250544 RepID=A0A5J5EK14_9PEZI|nr:hypothetical protein FN846DRAFT_911417 [Sphaerosporella brunnea]
MASGYGIKGDVGRCFPFWQDFLACYVTNTADSSSNWRCIPQKNDYTECLHHHKEIAKTKALRAAYLRRLQSGTDKNAPEGGKAGDAKVIGVL